MINTWQAWAASTVVGFGDSKWNSNLQIILSVFIFVQCSAADLIFIPFALGSYQWFMIMTICWNVWANFTRASYSKPSVNVHVLPDQHNKAA